MLTNKWNSLNDKSKENQKRWYCVQNLAERS